jgi:hypothetical protein
MVYIYLLTSRITHRSRTLELHTTSHFNSSRMLIQGERVVRKLSWLGVKEEYLCKRSDFVFLDYYDVREELCRASYHTTYTKYITDDVRLRQSLNLSQNLT